MPAKQVAHVEELRQVPSGQHTPDPAVVAVPTAQLLQEDEPAGLNVFAGQGRQEAGALAKVPAGHDVDVKAQDGEDALLYVPEEQFVQEEAPRRL